MLDGRKQATVFAIAVVELSQEGDPFALAARDFIEIVLHLRGEVAFDEVAKMLAEQLRYCERGEARHERLALPEDITSSNDRCDCRRVRRRAPNAQPLELFDERGLGESRRGNRFVTLGFSLKQRDGGGAVSMNAITHAALWQDGFLFLELGRRIVAPFDIGAAKTGELDRLAAGREHGGLTYRSLRRNLQGRAQHASVDHL